MLMLMPCPGSPKCPCAQVEHRLRSTVLLLDSTKRMEWRHSPAIGETGNKMTQTLPSSRASRCQEVWQKYHEAAGHPGIERTLANIRRCFYWPRMEEEVQGFHSGCVVCSLKKDKIEAKAPLNPIVVSYPLEVVALDFLSLGRPMDAYQNILVMTDMFTRYAWAVPTRDQTAKTTVRAIWSHVIQTFGCPGRFHSDMGPNFESTLMQQLCAMYGVTKSRTTPYHPAGNGRVERLNQTVLNLLRTLRGEKQNRWAEHVQELLQAYNNTVHSSTGFAPAYLMFGRHLRLPVDVELGVAPHQSRLALSGWVEDHHQKLTLAYKLARERMGHAAERDKRSYDRKAQALSLLPGERVWVRDRNRQGQGKIRSWWNPEPYVVVSLVGDSGVVYKVRPESGGKVRTQHRNALKPCITPVNVIPEPGTIVETEAEVDPLPFGFYVVPAFEPPEVGADILPPEPPAEVVDNALRRSARATRGLPPSRYRH
uniref:Gypsy retrotransposon integrase-like protein 1 n=1 Tax=Gasterosteus aculeatus aculeatus TaxID=481459 RepID=A0AAQ4Q030_GASAC